MGETTKQICCGSDEWDRGEGNDYPAQRRSMAQDGCGGWVPAVDPPRDIRVLVIDNNWEGDDPQVHIARWEGGMNGGNHVWLLDERFAALGGIVTHFRYLPDVSWAKKQDSEE